MQQLPQYLHRKQNQLWFTEVDRNNLTIDYRIKEVIFEGNSPFQHVLVVDSYDFGPMLILDGAIQTTAKDGFIYNEMITHIPLSLHPHPENVLIIGGGDCGAAKEVCKYDQVTNIDLVEIDELVVTACKQHLPEVSGNLSDPRVQFIFADGVEFVKNVRDQYDVIIIDSSDPVGPAVKLFQPEFYQNVHHALKKEGIVVRQSQSPIFHPHIMKQTFSRMGALFPVHHLYTATIPTYPGGWWSYTMASKQSAPLRREITFTKKAQYVNEETLQNCFALPQFIKDILEKN